MDAARIAGVLAYMLVLVGIGVAASRRMKDVRDYFAAGRRLGFWAVAFSARATGESAWLLLGLTGMGAAIGFRAFWVVAGEVLGVGAAWILMARRFNRLTHRYDAITVPDYLEARFRDGGHALRLLAAAALVVFVTIYVSAQIDATGKAFASFLGWDWAVGALVGYAVVLAYIVSGGFLAVVWSDVFQGALMFLGLTALPVVAVAAAGGPAAVLERLQAIDPALLSWTGGAGWSATGIAGLLSLLLIGLGFLGSPQIFVRFLALRDPGEVGRGTVVALTWTLLAEIGAVWIGLAGRALLTRPGQEVAAVLGNGGENVLPLLVEHLMPPLVIGLYIAIVLSAIMSTVDSLLVLAGSAWVRDWLQKVRRPDLPDDALVGASRRATFLLSLAALAVAMGVGLTTPERTIFWFVIFGWSGIAATFCPTMVLSLFWPGFTARGALVAMASGFAAVPLFKFAVPSLPGIGPFFAALGELPPAFAVSLAAGVAASLLDARGRERLAGIEEELAEAAR